MTSCLLYRTKQPARQRSKFFLLGVGPLAKSGKRENNRVGFLTNVSIRINRLNKCIYCGIAFM